MVKRIDPVPEGSIYFWMYTQGLRQIPYEEVEIALRDAGKIIREKDHDNYWNGYHNSVLYHGDPFSIPMPDKPQRNKYPSLSSFELNSLASMPPIKNRWVPCNSDNKPLIKWSKGCMTHADAMARRGYQYMAENLKGTDRIVIDFDIEHGDKRDEGLADFAAMFLDTNKYCCFVRMDGEKIASMHLMFSTDLLIPTMHFPEAKIDILGNANNQLRYFKNKQWNRVKATPLNETEWNLIMNYLMTKEVRNGKENNDSIGILE